MGESGKVVIERVWETVQRSHQLEVRLHLTALGGDDFEREDAASRLTELRNGHMDDWEKDRLVTVSDMVSVELGLFEKFARTIVRANGIEAYNRIFAAYPRSMKC